MFGRPIPLFNLFGFPIRLDPSWFIVAILLIWSLASTIFPQTYPGLGGAAYWLMGITAAFGLFASIVLHEIGHSVVARHYGIPIRGITLFIFGGVAELEREPASAKAELLISLVGPLVSLLLVGVFGGLTALAALLIGFLPLVAVLFYLATINLMVVLFNLIPAFPLDGGRVLRAGLWKAWGNMRAATRVTAQIGSGFGLFFIGLGIFNVFTGNIIGGIWLGLIGLFLRTIARKSYQQVLVRQALEGEPVQRFMETNPFTVAPGLLVKDVIEQYVYRSDSRLFPVVANGSLVGCVTLNGIKNLSATERATRTVGDVMEACSEAQTIRADADAMEALAQMNGERARLLVVDNGHLRGVVTRRDLMRFFSMQIELGETAQRWQATVTPPQAGNSRP